MAEAQASLDGWVDHYNNVRPHQSVGMVPPVERFNLAGAAGQVSDVDDTGCTGRAVGCPSVRA